MPACLQISGYFGRKAFLGVGAWSYCTHFGLVFEEGGGGGAPQSPKPSISVL